MGKDERNVVGGPFPGDGHLAVEGIEEEQEGGAQQARPSHPAIHHGHQAVTVG